MRCARCEGLLIRVVCYSALNNRCVLGAMKFTLAGTNPNSHVLLNSPWIDSRETLGKCTMFQTADFTVL